MCFHRQMFSSHFVVELVKLGETIVSTVHAHSRCYSFFSNPLSISMANVWVSLPYINVKRSSSMIEPKTERQRNIILCTIKRTSHVSAHQTHTLGLAPNSPEHIIVDAEPLFPLAPDEARNTLSSVWCTARHDIMSL